jgi:hypothetical protein
MELQSPQGCLDGSPAQRWHLALLQYVARIDSLLADVSGLRNGCAVGERTSITLYAFYQDELLIHEADVNVV